MRKRYSHEEIQFIKEQAGQGQSREKIAAVLGVDATSVSNAMHRHGIKSCRKPIVPIAGEVWVTDPTLPDIQISNFGRFARESTKSIIDGYQTTGGYTTVDFSGIGTFAAHRVVAQAFIPNPENKPEVNHKDGHKGENRVDNLEWATPSENIQHAFRTGLIVARSGQEHHRTALTEQQIAICSEMRIDGKTFKEIAEIHGVDRKTVSRHVNLHRRSAERSETIP